MLDAAGAVLEEAVAFAVAHETPWATDLEAVIRETHADEGPFAEIIGPTRPRGGPNGLGLPTPGGIGSPEVECTPPVRVGCSKRKDCGADGGRRTASAAQPSWSTASGAACGVIASRRRKPSASREVRLSSSARVPI